MTAGPSLTTRAGRRPQLEINLSGAVGLSRNLWLDASLGALQVAPSVGIHSPRVGVSVLLLDSPALELDAIWHITFASQDRRPIEQIESGLSSVLHLPHRLRLDTALYLDVNPGSEALLGLRLPLDFGFQITRHIHAVVNTGVTVPNLHDARTTTIPVGLTLGFSDRVGAGRESFSVLPSISFPNLIKPGASRIFWPGHTQVGVTFVFVSTW